MSDPATLSLKLFSKQIDHQARYMRTVRVIATRASSSCVHVRKKIYPSLASLTSSYVGILLLPRMQV
jgi:hypothetical protein